MAFLNVLSLLDVLAFVLALFVYAYLFNRNGDEDETTYLALTMHEINNVETATGKAKAAGAA